MEEAVARAAQGLGLVDRNVGVFDQGLKVLRIFGEQRNADAGGHPHRSVGQLHRLFHHAQNALGHFAQRLPVVDVAHHHQKLVAALAAHHVHLAQRVAQAARHLDQQLVASGMAHGVVDRLEAVQVDKKDAKLLLAAVRLQHLALHQVDEQGAVGQAGELVVKRHLLQLGVFGAQLAKQGAQLFLHPPQMAAQQAQFILAAPDKTGPVHSTVLSMVQQGRGLLLEPLNRAQHARDQHRHQHRQNRQHLQRHQRQHLAAPRLQQALAVGGVKPHHQRAQHLARTHHGLGAPCEAAGGGFGGQGFAVIGPHPLQFGGVGEAVLDAHGHHLRALQQAHGRSVQRHPVHHPHGFGNRHAADLHERGFALGQQGLLGFLRQLLLQRQQQQGRQGHTHHHHHHHGVTQRQTGTPTGTQTGEAQGETVHRGVWHSDKHRQCQAQNRWSSHWRRAANTGAASSSLKISW